MQNLGHCLHMLMWDCKRRRFLCACQTKQSPIIIYKSSKTQQSYIFVACTSASPCPSLLYCSYEKACHVAATAMRSAASAKSNLTGT